MWGYSAEMTGGRRWITVVTLAWTAREALLQARRRRPNWGVSHALRGRRRAWPFLPFFGRIAASYVCHGYQLYHYFKCFKYYFKWRELYVQSQWRLCSMYTQVQLYIVLHTTPAVWAWAHLHTFINRHMCVYTERNTPNPHTHTRTRVRVRTYTQNFLDK